MGKNYQALNIAKFNNTISATQTTEPSVPILQYNIGGSYGGIITSLSLAFNTQAQQNAYIKTTIDGILISPQEFQAPSQTFNTFNYIQSGDTWDLEPNAKLNVYAYNFTGLGSGMLFDLITTIKQRPAPLR